MKVLIFALLSLLEQKFFVGFLGELKKLKSLFEINWPLVDECLTNEKLVNSILRLIYSVSTLSQS